MPLDPYDTVKLPALTQSIDFILPGYAAANADAIFVIERWKGKLMLQVYADITQEQPTHSIDLSGAAAHLRPFPPSPDAPVPD